MIAYGLPYNKALISICFGARWSTPEMIAALNVYIFLLALLPINGIIEMFQLSSLKPQDMRVYNLMICTNWLLFVGMLLYFGTMDCIGIFLAEVLSKILRITFSVCYLGRESLQINVLKFVKQCLPNKLLIISFVLAYYSGMWLKNLFSNNHLKCMLVGTIHGVVHLSMIIYYMKKEIKELYKYLKTSDDSKLKSEETKK